MKPIGRSVKEKTDPETLSVAVHRCRVSDLTKNNDFKRTVESMFEMNLDIDAPNSDRITLFYSAIQNQEWEIAEYLLEIGADSKLVPSDDRPQSCALSFSSFDESLPVDAQIKNRISCLHTLHKSGFVDEDKEFTKRLLFVGRYDLKDIIRRIIEILPYGPYISFEHLFEECCSRDWVDLYAGWIRKAHAVTFPQFLHAFDEGSFSFFRMLCNKDIESFGKIGKTADALVSFEKLISPFRNKEKLAYILDFIESNNLVDCCRGLFATSASIGCSYLVERTLHMYPANVFIKVIDDSLIERMFSRCARGIIKENVDQNWRKIQNTENLLEWITSLKLVVTKATSINGETMDVGWIFERNEIRLIARTILQNRLDIVERLLSNYAFNSISRSPTNASNIQISPMCCAISCTDKETIEFLIEQGLSICDSCCCKCPPSHPYIPPTSLLCGIETMLDLNSGRNGTFEALGNIKSIVEYAARVSGVFVRLTRRRPIELNNKALHVLDFISFSCRTYNRQSAKFKLELLKFFLGLCDTNLYVPPSARYTFSITDFFVANEMAESELFCLFQAGTSPELIRSVHVYLLAEYGSRQEYTYNTRICQGLIVERMIEFGKIQMSPEPYVAQPRGAVRYNPMREARRKMGVNNSSAFKHSMVEFREWHGSATRSPFSLRTECRTLIRKVLINASQHRSILKRIGLLHLPEKLKKFLIYE